VADLGGLVRHHPLDRGLRERLGEAVGARSGEHGEHRAGVTAQLGGRVIEGGRLDCEHDHVARVAQDCERVAGLAPHLCRERRGPLADEITEQHRLGAPLRGRPPARHRRGHVPSACEAEPHDGRKGTGLGEIRRPRTREQHQMPEA
jgi:hypothetical protein